MIIKLKQKESGFREILIFNKIHNLFILIFLWALSPFVSNAQNLFAGYEHFFQEPRTYIVGKTIDAITIDGKAEESSWNSAAWSDDFMDIEGDRKPIPLYRTCMKMLWNNSYLYIFTEMEEPHVWAYFDQHDQIVYHENDFEVFLDPDGDTHNYFEFEVNALNTVFDLFLTRPYWDGGLPLISWNAPGFKSAVNVDGTLNNPSDIDEKWTVEMAVPFESMFLYLNAKAPVDGQIWKVNFSRVQWKTKVVKGKYEKLKDEKTGLPLRDDNWVWSPTGEINLHVPERWGMLQFSEKPVNAGLPSCDLPEVEILKKYLWLVYYKQEAYRVENNKFALSLDEITMPETLHDGAGVGLKLRMEATTLQFTAFLTTADKRTFSINNQGYISEIKHKP